MSNDIKTITIVTFDNRTVDIFKPDFAVAADVRKGSERGNTVQVSIGGVVDQFTNVQMMFTRFADDTTAARQANNPEEGDYSLK